MCDMDGVVVILGYISEAVCVASSGIVGVTVLLISSNVGEAVLLFVGDSKVNVAVLLLLVAVAS